MAVIYNSGYYLAPYESLFLMDLFRFSRSRCIRPKMESYFGFRRSKILAGVKEMVIALYYVAKPDLESHQIFKVRMDCYAEKIANKCGWLLNTVWGFFINQTLRKTCCPSYFQKLLYSGGHKRAHGIKFQSVFTMIPWTDNWWQPTWLIHACKIRTYSKAARVHTICWRWNRLLPLRWPSLPAFTLCFWWIQKSAARFRPSTLEYRYVQGLQGGGVGICKPHFEVAFCDFKASTILWQHFSVTLGPASSETKFWITSIAMRWRLMTTYRSSIMINTWYTATSS